MASMMRAHVGPVVAFRGSIRVRDRCVAVKRGGSARSVGDRFRLGVGGCAMGHINGSKKTKRANAEERGVINAANVMESALARTDISTAEATMEGSAMEGSRIESSTPTIGTTLQLSKSGKVAAAFAACAAFVAFSFRRFLNLNFLVRKYKPARVLCGAKEGAASAPTRGARVAGYSTVAAW